MVNMLYAFIAIALMFVVNFLVIHARRQEKGWLRNILLVFAFLLLFPTLLLIFVVVFAW